MKLVSVILPIVYLFICGLESYAQGSKDVFEIVQQKSASGGEIEIVQEDRLYRSVNEHIRFQRNQKGIPGYRINITSEKNRKLAEAERARFLQLYPDINAYLEYVAPSFNVYVGDFRKRSDVYKKFRQVKTEFPNAYIVPMSINFPKLE
jgi:hypothetical protein